MDNGMQLVAAELLLVHAQRLFGRAWHIVPNAHVLWWDF
jgi:hypothetical protein